MFRYTVKYSISDFVVYWNNVSEFVLTILFHIPRGLILHLALSFSKLPRT